ncbi:MAG: SDR family NAD(P)-dependent oxidoreductase [Actinomycetota bacterium]
MITDFTDTTAVITGGASGIGLAMARKFATEGSSLVLADIEADALDAAIAEFEAADTPVLGVITDVSQQASVEALRDAAIDRFGSVEILCNNAGVGLGGPFLDDDPDYVAKFQWTMDVNLMGVLYGIRAFVPGMVERGAPAHVVNTASMAGLVSAGLGAYTVSKFGCVSMSELLAIELGRTNVGVSVLCPEFVRTRIHESHRNAPDDLAGQERVDPKATEIMKAFVEGGIDPADVADAVHDAIINDRFAILTHAVSGKAMIARAETFAEGGLFNPTGGFGS